MLADMKKKRCSSYRFLAIFSKKLGFLVDSGIQMFEETLGRIHSKSYDPGLEIKEQMLPLETLVGLIYFLESPLKKEKCTLLPDPSSDPRSPKKTTYGAPQRLCLDYGNPDQMPHCNTCHQVLAETQSTREDLIDQPLLNADFT
ncbi:hypothetical protein STEG23_024631 [Scotinomys teguina]